MGNHQKLVKDWMDMVRTLVPGTIEFDRTLSMGLQPELSVTAWVDFVEDNPGLAERPEKRLRIG